MEGRISHNEVDKSLNYHGRKHKRQYGEKKLNSIFAQKNNKMIHLEKESSEKFIKYMREESSKKFKEDLEKNHEYYTETCRD